MAAMAMNLLESKVRGGLSRPLCRLAPFYLPGSYPRSHLARRCTTVSHRRVVEPIACRADKVCDSLRGVSTELLQTSR